MENTSSLICLCISFCSVRATFRYRFGDRDSPRAASPATRVQFIEYSVSTADALIVFRSIEQLVDSNIGCHRNDFSGIG